HSARACHLDRATAANQYRSSSKTHGTVISNRDVNRDPTQRSSCDSESLLRNAAAPLTRRNQNPMALRLKHLLQAQQLATTDNVQRAHYRFACRSWCGLP